MRNTIIIAALFLISACGGTMEEKAAGRVVQRTQVPGDSLQVAYEFEVAGNLYQGSTVLAPGAVLPSDSVQVAFLETEPGKCRLIMP